MSRTEIVERERRFVTVADGQPDHERCSRCCCADSSGNIPSRVPGSGGHGDLTGRRRVNAGQGPNRDARPVEFLEFDATVRAIDQVPGHPSMFECDKFSVEIRGGAVAEVTVRKKTRRYLEFRQQTERSAGPLEGTEFANQLFVAVEKVTDHYNFVRCQLSIEIR
jgi:hypothetical protein